MGELEARFSDEVGQFAEEIVEALTPIGPVTWKKMFGGAGLFIDGKMFGLIDSAAVLHLKADDSNRPKFEGAGAVKHSRMPYYSVSDEVLADHDQLLEWARVSADVARS